MSIEEATYELDFRPMMLGEEARQKTYAENRIRRVVHQKSREEYVEALNAFLGAGALFLGCFCLVILGALF